MIAFSFTKTAREEVARVLAEKGIEIELVDVATLCEGPPDRATPDLSRVESHDDRAEARGGLSVDALVVDGESGHAG